MSWKWYGVKTLYRWKSAGRPRAVDEHFANSVSLLEERVVLVRARSFDEAIARAEKEARKYARTSHRNPYGQWVRTKYLQACDAFEILEEPGVGTEVFSTTEIIQRRTSDRSLVDARLGKDEKRPSPLRRNFLNAEFFGRVKTKT